MKIRWRLGILAIQLIALLGGTRLVLGNVPIGQTWFVAGLLAIVINRPLLEPYYPRPGDVVGNATVGIVMWLAADRDQLHMRWNALLTGLLAAAALGVVALDRSGRTTDHSGSPLSPRGAPNCAARIRNSSTRRSFGLLC